MAGIDAGASRQPGDSVVPAARSVAPRQSVQGGRFARWHQEASPPGEEDSWLITYLDVMTLLLVMMVVMLAFSEPASKTPKAVVVAKPDAALPVPLAVASGPIPGAPNLIAGGSIVPPTRPPGDPHEHLPLDQLGNQVEVIKSGSSLRFRISSELLFAPGETSLTPEGLRLLDTLLPTFNLAIDRHIVVEGHTDNTPISTDRFPSNWELAAGRAGSVVRHLQSRGLNPTRLSATGYAETRPIESNRTPQGQRANRRVELILELPRQGG
jgi:chemotaxis protein MotB